MNNLSLYDQNGLYLKDITFYESRKILRLRLVDLSVDPYGLKSLVETDVLIKELDSPKKIKRTYGEFYGNYFVLDVDDILIFRASFEKVLWYISSGLATIVSSKIIKLNFVTNGPGNLNDEYYLQDKKNICVICGCDNNLSRHYVVPHCYRKFFSSDVIFHSYHDILLTCRPCHMAYEKQASIKKQELAEKYNAPVNGIYTEIDHDQRCACLTARTLLLHSNEIPEHKKIPLVQRVEAYFKKPISELNLNEISYNVDLYPKLIKTHGEIVVGQIINEKREQEFFEEWRQHFLNFAMPKFVPPHWNVNRNFKHNTNWNIRSHKMINYNGIRKEMKEAGWIRCDRSKNGKPEELWQRPGSDKLMTFESAERRFKKDKLLKN